MNKTILIVDDSVVVRASTRFTLSKAGYEVAEAPNGEEALKVLDTLVKDSKRPSMIITDINMPVMDGILFIKNVKQTANKFVPILVLTTESQPSKKDEGRRAGAAGWLVKPFAEDQLLSVVRKLVR